MNENESLFNDERRITTAAQSNTVNERQFMNRESAVENGRFLNSKKDEVGHGHFHEWCQANLRYGQDRIALYLAIYNHRALIERDIQPSNFTLNAAKIYLRKISKPHGNKKTEAEKRAAVIQKFFKKYTVAEINKAIEHLGFIVVDHNDPELFGSPET